MSELTGVARGGLHEDSLARGDEALLLGLLDHALADTVLDTVARLHALQLQPNVGLDALR